MITVTTSPREAETFLGEPPNNLEAGTNSEDKQPGPHNSENIQHKLSQHDSEDNLPGPDNSEDSQHERHKLQFECSEDGLHNTEDSQNERHRLQFECNEDGLHNTEDSQNERHRLQFECNEHGLYNTEDSQNERHRLQFECNEDGLHNTEDSQNERHRLQFECNEHGLHNTEDSQNERHRLQFECNEHGLYNTEDSQNERHRLQFECNEHGLYNTEDSQNERHRLQFECNEHGLHNTEDSQHERHRLQFEDSDGFHNSEEDIRNGGPHNFENIISAMGLPGRYQIIQCILLSVNLIPSVFINMNFVFIGREPPFSCSRVNETSLFQELSHHSTNETMPYQTVYEQCQILVTSNASGTNKDVNGFDCYDGYSYTGGNHVSIRTEWDLVCDSRGAAEMAQTSMALGWFIGVFLASTLSDKIGRKKTIAIAIAVSSISELCCSFAPNIYVVISLRFVSGLFGSGITAIAVVLGSEMLVSKYRGIFCVYMGLTWSFVAFLLCGIAYIFRNHSWRDLQLCLAICNVTPLLFIYFTDESTSWLYSKAKYPQATRNIHKMCRINRLESDKIKTTWNKMCIQEKKPGSDMKDAKDYNVLDLLRNAQFRVYIFIAWFVCFSSDLSYFGLFLSASTLAGSLYLNTAIMALLEFPGCFVVLLMLRHKGRRFVIIFFTAMGAVCLTVSTFLGSAGTTHSVHISNTATAFFLLGRFAIANSYTTLYLYIAELFPTTLRTSGQGICMTGGCLGSMLAPYLLPLHDLVRWVPGTCLVSLLTISVFLLLKLPETRGRQLASTFESIHIQNGCEKVRSIPKKQDC